MQGDPYRKAEFFPAATLEELQEIYDLIDLMPAWWLIALIDWANGELAYSPYSYSSGAQYIIGTLKRDLHI